MHRFGMWMCTVSLLLIGSRAAADGPPNASRDTDPDPEPRPARDGAPWTDSLYPGQFVRVGIRQDDAERIERGTVLAFDEQRLLLQLEQKAKGYSSRTATQPLVLEIRRQDITHVEVGIRKGSHVAAGLLLGGVGGAFLGGVLAASTTEGPDPDDFIRINTKGIAGFYGAVLGGLFGLAIGGGIGASKERISWHRMPPLTYGLQLDSSESSELRIGVQLGY